MPLYAPLQGTLSFIFSIALLVFIITSSYRCQCGGGIIADDEIKEISRFAVYWPSLKYFMATVRVDQ